MAVLPMCAALAACGSSDLGFAADVPYDADDVETDAAPPTGRGLAEWPLASHGAGRSVVVVLESGKEAKSDSVGIRHALDAFGIPYVVTASVAQAVRAPEMIVVAGAVTNRGGAALATWAQTRGHTLVFGRNKEPALLAPLGLVVDDASASASAPRSRLALTSATGLLAFADAAEEQNLPLLPNVAHVAYAGAPRANATLLTLARYADGGLGAVLATQPSGGHVVAFGSAFGDMLTRFEVGKGVTDGCTNAFLPAVDTIRLVLRRTYESFTRYPVPIRLAPQGKKAAVILTHDMDASTSFIGFRDVFAPLEESLGVRSTMFVTTNYRDTGWLKQFYGTGETQEILTSAASRGYGVQSHSVSHMPDFNTFPLGELQVDAATYTPTYRSADKRSAGGTVRGELMVSRALLLQDFGIQATGFRAGYLAKPSALPDTVEEAGYAYDASNCAGEVGGTFPFRALSGYSTTGRETNVLEVPLSIGDKYIESRTSDETRALWIDVTQKNAANGAPTVILVHPTNPEEKIDAYAGWLTWATSQPDLWVGTMEAYYAFLQERGVSSRIEGFPW